MPEETLAAAVAATAHHALVVPEDVFSRITVEGVVALMVEEHRRAREAEIEVVTAELDAAQTATTNVMRVAHMLWEAQVVDQQRERLIPWRDAILAATSGKVIVPLHPKPFELEHGMEQGIRAFWSHESLVPHGSVAARWIHEFGPGGTQRDTFPGSGEPEGCTTWAFTARVPRGEQHSRVEYKLVVHGSWAPGEAVLRAIQDVEAPRGLAERLRRELNRLREEIQPNNLAELERSARASLTEAALQKAGFSITDLRLRGRPPRTVAITQGDR